MGFLPTWLTSTPHWTPQQPPTDHLGREDDCDLLITVAPESGEGRRTLSTAGLSAEAAVPEARPCQRPRVHACTRGAGRTREGACWGIYFLINL